MTYPAFNSGDILTATDMNAVGLWLVKSQTIGSGVPSVDITSCFNTNYDNYLVTFNGVTASSNGTNLAFQLLSGTTPSTTGYSSNTYYVVTGQGGGLTNAAISNGANGEIGSLSTSTKNSGVAYLQAPFLAEYTRSQHQNADNNYLRWNSGVHTIASSYNGIKLFPSAGTLTGGTVRVYGYRN